MESSRFKAMHLLLQVHHKEEPRATQSALNKTQLIFHRSHSIMIHHIHSFMENFPCQFDPNQWPMVFQFMCSSWVINLMVICIIHRGGVYLGSVILFVTKSPLYRSLKSIAFNCYIHIICSAIPWKNSHVEML